jgi:hypothetical protein
LKDPQAQWDRAAITTYGERNHAVRTGRYRYIHYEDATEELYDLRHDPNEWTNLADKPGYEDVKRRLGEWLPKTNTSWSPDTFNTANDYFREKTAAGSKGDQPEGGNSK